jgi:hypothetical protein
VIGKLVHDMPGVLDVMRAQRDRLNLSHETLDAISGLPSGYVGKVLAPEPVRGLGYMSLGALLGALGLALIVVEDSAAAERVRRKWVPRKRPQRLESPPPRTGALISGSGDVTPLGTTTEIDHEA